MCPVPAGMSRLQPGQTYDLTASPGMTARTSESAAADGSSIGPVRCCPRVGGFDGGPDPAARARPFSFPPDRFFFRLLRRLSGSMPSATSSASRRALAASRERFLDGMMIRNRPSR